VPIPTTLFPALHGYRRGLFSGRAVSVYYDRHPRNEWAAHSREEDQISAILDRAVCTLKWKPVGSDWRERELQGPAAWLIPAGTPHALVCPAPTDMVTLFMDRTYADAMAAGRNAGVTIADLDYLTGRDALIGHDRHRVPPQTCAR
jgi:hypothetical protein